MDHHCCNGGAINPETNMSEVYEPIPYSHTKLLTHKLCNKCVTHHEKKKPCPIQEEVNHQLLKGFEINKS